MKAWAFIFTFIKYGKQLLLLLLLFFLHDHITCSSFFSNIYKLDDCSKQQSLFPAFIQWVTCCMWPVQAVQFGFRFDEKKNFCNFQVSFGGVSLNLNEMQINRSNSMCFGIAFFQGVTISPYKHFIHGWFKWLWKSKYRNVYTQRRFVD